MSTVVTPTRKPGSDRLLIGVGVFAVILILGALVVGQFGMPAATPDQLTWMRSATTVAITVIHSISPR